MAQFNEILTGSLSQILTRRLGMQTGTPAPTLAPEIMPVLNLENDRPEWAYLAGTRLWGVAGGVGAGGAGTYAQVHLYNPPGSNIIAVVSYVLGLATGGCLLEVDKGAIAAPPFTAAAGIPRDTRLSANAANYQASAVQPYVRADGPSFGSNDIARLSVSNQGIYREPIVLTPGNGLGLFVLTANTVLDHYTFAWSERAAVQGELLG